MVLICGSADGHRRGRGGARSGGRASGLRSLPSREANEQGGLKQGRKKKARRKRDAGSRASHSLDPGAAGFLPATTTPAGSSSSAGSHGRGRGDQARCVGWSGTQDEGDGRRGFGSWVRALVGGEPREAVDRWIGSSRWRGGWLGMDPEEDGGGGVGRMGQAS